MTARALLLAALLLPAVVSGVLDSRRTSLENTLISVERATADFAQAAKSLVPLTEDLDRLIKTVEANSEKTLGNISERFSADEMGMVIKDVRDFLATASISLKRVESILLEQQVELQRTFSNLSVTVDNLARFSREIADEPSVILRTRKDKK